MRGKEGSVFLVLAVTILMMSFASAGWLSDSWNKLTGNKISGKVVYENVNGMNCMQGAVGYYSFENNMEDLISGGDVANHGAVVVNGGKVGKGLSLDGKSWLDLGAKYSYIPGDVGVKYTWPHGLSDRTICAWAKTNSVSQQFAWILAYGYYSITSFRDALNPKKWRVLIYQPMFIGRGTDAFWGGGGNWDDVYTNSPNKWVVGEWNYICLTYTPGMAKLYDNGNLIASAAKSWNMPGGVYRIGRQISETTNEFWDGVVDEVAVFNKTLSADEVKYLYNNGNGKAVCTGTPVVCDEDWSCDSWSSCSNNQKTRTCSDANSCGSVISKPLVSQSCSVNPSCTENWNCSSWTTCTSNQQTKECADANNCGTFANKPPVVQSCTTEICNENWNCSSWSFCSNNQKTRTCSDANSCGSVVNKPDLSQTCSTSGCAEEQKCTSWSKCINGQQNQTCGNVSYNLSLMECKCVDNCDISVGEIKIRTCSSEQETCSSLIEKVKNPTDFTDEYGYEYFNSWNYSYSWSTWINEKEHAVKSYQAGWQSQAGESYFYPSYQIHVFDEPIALDYLKQTMNWNLCSSQAITDTNEKNNVVYVCSYYYKEAEENNARAYWINGDNKNILIEFYGGIGKSYDEPQYSEEQVRKINDFAQKLDDNYYQYANPHIPWNFQRIIAKDMNYCGSMLEMSVNPKTNETCGSCWSCKIEPVVCPEYGYQKKICIDSCCETEKQESQLYCSPGVCSGCYVPRWIGSNDNICVPYGFRFEQETGFERKLVEYSDEETLTTSENRDYSLEIISDTEAKFTLFLGSKNYTYDLKEGESMIVTLPEWEDDIDSFTLYALDIVPASGGKEGYVSLKITVRGWDKQINKFNAYCDFSGEVRVQKSDWGECQNSYECESNLCSGGECTGINQMIKQGSAFKALGVKILCKFADLFGIEKYETCVADYLGS